MAVQMDSDRGDVDKSDVASLTGLATALWDVRDAMGDVLFKLATERLIVTAGEVRWRTAPNALGSAGIGASLGDTNLGGTTFVFKVLLGR